MRPLLQERLCLASNPKDTQGQYLSERASYEILRAQLEADRSSFISHWSDLSQNIFPRRSRFTVTDTNKGDRRNQKIIDSTATLAARTLRAGMMGGVTSPARPWFRLTTPDPELAEMAAVKEWLFTVTSRMNLVFLRSNLYNCLPIVYGDMGTFGTSAMMVEEDFQSVIRFYPFPIGSYSISNNSRLKVDTFMRDFQLSVRQVIEKFATDEKGNIDWSILSEAMKQYYERGQMETQVYITHLIKPNPDYDPKRVESKYKKYLSVYFERGNIGNQTTNYLTSTDSTRYLSKKGYDLFPVLCPRWEITAEDSYGTDCPGMSSLGDIRQLQIMQKRKAQAIEKMVNPPMVGPTSLRNQKASILPGDLTFEDLRDGQKGFRPAHDVNLNLSHLEEEIMNIQKRISRAWFEDLFLLMAQDDRSGVTATEINEKKEEKLLAVGPVLEQLNQDLLDPLIDLTYDIMSRQGLIPPPPPELHGMPLKVEYISIMAQAQKALGISGIERFAGFMTNIGAAIPTVFDKIDTDELVNVYGDMTSVPPTMIRDQDAVQQIRDARSQQQQAQAKAEMIQQGAGAAKDLAGADMSGNNALTQLISQAKAGQAG